MRLRNPIIYFGGKGNMVTKLLRLIPPHDVYVEVFGGGASLLFAKEPSKIEIYNEIDQNIVSLFKVIKDINLANKFQLLATLTPYSREEFSFCKENLDNCNNLLDKAYTLFIISRQSFSGSMGAWGTSLTTSRRGMANRISSYLNTLLSIPDLSNRLANVKILEKDFRVIIPQLDSVNTFFYLDPPYVPSTRRSGEYKHEMTIEDHKDLLELLLNIKGKVMLSGYNNELYETYLNNRNGWSRIDYKTVCHAVGKTRNSGLQGNGVLLLNQPRIESVWVNYIL